MLIVAIDFAFDADIGCGESRGPRGWPVAMNPAAVDLNLENRRQQTGKRPIEAIVDGVPSFDGMIEGRKIRHDGLVGDRRIVKRERADEKGDCQQFRAR